MRFLIYLFLFMSVIGFSQHSLTGRVLEQDGNPIAYAQVLLESKDSIYKISELTDEDGNFKIINIPDANYGLSIIFFSKTIFNQDIRLNSDLVLSDIVANAGLLIDEVVVEGKLNIEKEPGKYTITNIGTSPLSKNNSTYDFLGSLPYVDKNAEGNSLYINNKKEATVLINGKKTGNNEIALNILKSTPAEDIKKIEIIKNPGSEYNADNKTGIINIIIKRKDEGWRGAVFASDNQSYYNSQSINSNISFSKNKLIATSGIGIGNNRFKLKEILKYKNYSIEQQTQINNNYTSESKYLTPYLNLNYDLSSNQKLGVQFNTSIKDVLTKRVSTNSYNSLFSSNPDSTNESVILKETPKYNYLFTNVSYSIKTDSLGSKFETNFYSINQENFNQITNDFLWTNAYQSIIQSPEIKNNLNSITTDYNQIFKNDDALSIGASYNNATIKNNFFYMHFIDNVYITDTLLSNKSTYIDKVFSLYAKYGKLLGDNWETEIGLRWENYEGRGEFDNFNAIPLKSNYVFPSIFLLFSPHDNHEFSLDYVSSIRRPSYSCYNPNILYTSSKSYKRSNPNILPILAHTFNFNYSFFKYYSFDVEYSIAKNVFNDFDIVKPDGFIETVTDNFGDGQELWVDLSYTKQFFNKRWNLTSTISYIYDENTGTYNQFNLGYENNEWSVDLKNYIYLNKKKNTVFNLRYGYNSSSNSIIGEMNGMHYLIVELSKSFKNWRCSMGAFNLIQPDLVLQEENSEFGFYKKRETYNTAYINISYFFGNDKVKSANKKQTELNDRL